MKEETMEKKLVYICSPLRGDAEKNIIKAQNYCREAMLLFPGIIPIAPHVYFTQFLDDGKSAERRAGMDAGIELLRLCQEVWVYGMANPSEGMKAEIKKAEELGIPVLDAADVYRAQLPADEGGGQYGA